MEELLQDFLIVNGEIVSENTESFFYKLIVNDATLGTIRKLYESDCIEEIKTENGTIIDINSISATSETQYIIIEFIIAELERVGWYLKFSDFTIKNRYKIPEEYYISELDYFSSSNDLNPEIEKYKAITTLIEKLSSKAKFISEEHHKLLGVVQDNSFIEIPIESTFYEEYLDAQNTPLVNQYLSDIEAYKEKKSIFLKELIDFLTPKAKFERINELLINFDVFYERCETSFEYYLSNFSFNKIKVELDNAVLEYSKNIRAIINDSQSKLIAIPAAFILGVSQINFQESLSIKNGLIVVSAFLFSYILSIFIKNQVNALLIVKDNLDNYKQNYSRSKSNQFEEEKDLKSLTNLINTAFSKIETELEQQEKRLGILQKCNWGVSITLLFILIIYHYSQEITKVFYHIAYP